MSSTRPDLKFSDTVDERSFYRRFSNLAPKDNASIIRIIDHKDYFSVLGDDATLIAEAIYKTSSVIKTSNSVKYVTFSPQVFSSVLRFCLVANSYKVEIYNKMFALILSATPGNLEGLAQEYGIDLESMLNDGSVPMVASVKLMSSTSSKKVGVSLIDLSNKAIKLSEFEDNDLFSNLESLLLQVNVKEIILPSTYDPADQSTPEIIKLFQVLNKVGGLIIGAVKPTYFSTKDIDQDLSKIVASENVDSDANNNVELILASKGISSTDDMLSLSCCSSLIHYLNLLSDDTASFTISKYSVSEYMRIDSSTMRALNIFPASQASDMAVSKSKSVVSIFDLLNKCKTSAGTRLLSQWLKQPLTDIEQIADRHSLVEHFITNTSLRVYVSQEWLSRIPDIKRLMKKIASGIKRPSSSENKKLEDVIRLYQLVKTIPELIKMLQMSIEDCNNESVKELIESNWLVSIQTNHQSLLKYQELVETTIDLKPLESSSTSTLFTDFNIKPEFDETLVSINENLNSTSSKIREIHEEVADDLNIDIEKRLKLEKHQQHGWCFRVTRNDSNILRNTSDRYIELQTVKAGVFFTTKKLRTLSQNYSEFSDEYNNKQKELIKEILSITLTYQSVFLKLSLALSSLDVISSFANVAIFAPIPFVKPILHKMADSVTSADFDDRKIKLKDARHPILEVQDEVSFIPNDVNLANSDGSPFVIITGPNMGGKSTYIRQIGVVALMNQVGSYVPVSDRDDAPEIPIFDAILSRVGAGDSQLKGLSTFMIEMLETSSILASATHNSLIIIDELGRGTSTYDGFGLAWSISEHLITQKSCFTLFATHFHELTKLSEKHAGKVQNLHVVAHVEKNGDTETKDDDITLMFKVEPGISDKSFGLHVAELVRFPSKIINMAKRKASELQDISVGSDTDPYIGNKRTKCNSEEIGEGLKKLKEVLSDWKASCIEFNQGKQISSGDAISKLKDLLSSKNQNIRNDKFIAEILSML